MNLFGASPAKNGGSRVRPYKVFASPVKPNSAPIKTVKTKRAFVLQLETN